MRAFLLSIATSLLFSCSSKSNDATAPTPVQEEPKPEFWSADCDPLVPWHCGFPFPSNTQLADDPTSPTKKRVKFKADSLPRWHQNQTNPKAFESFDGFSTGTTLTTYMWRATATGMPTADNLELSVSKDSPIVVVDAETGELVPHLSGIDMQPKDDDARAILIRPVTRLKDGTRYLVAIRKVVDKDGKVLPPSKEFAALRDGTPSNEPSIEARRKLYDDDIFPKLEKAGIGKADLQLAWDFSTGSRETVTKWLVGMRDDALKTVGDPGPEYTITKVEDDICPDVKRRIKGTFKVPLYLDQPLPPGHLQFGPDGLPKQNGTAEYEFTVWIPPSATTKPGPLIQNGHGLLGSQNEGNCSYLTQFANTYGYVAFSVDWVGMAGTADQNVITDAITQDIGNFQTSVDRQHQGMVNLLLAMRMMKGRFKDDPNVQFAGKSAIDPTQGTFYRGDSQGGIMGGTIASISTDVTRALLSVPGAPYSFLLDRSVDFAAFHFILQGSYTSPLDIPIVLGLVQLMWDRTEPNGYLAYATKNMLPGTPKHDILIQDALGDHQVSPYGAHYIARTIGAKLLQPAVRPLFGVDPAPYPLDSGSAIVEFDPHTPKAPLENLPPDDTGDDPHELVRRLTAAQKMADTFFRTGKIIQTCDGPCDPE